MGEELLRRRFERVDGAEQAKLLADPKAMVYLKPFLGRERSLSEAAALLGVSTHALFYWTQRFTALGLLRVARTTERRGRAVKHYATAGDGFFVPFSAIPDNSLETLLHQQEEPWQRLLAHTLVRVGSDTFPDLHRWDMALYQREDVLYIDITPTPDDGRTLNEIALEPTSPALLMDWYTFSLTFAEAKTFQTELYALVQKYAQKRGPQSYLARITLVPLVDSETS